MNAADSTTRFDRTVPWVLLSLGSLSASGAIVRLFRLDPVSGLDQTTLLYLVVAGALLLFRDVKAITWGDKKIELGRLRQELEATQQAVATMAETVPAALALGVGGREAPGPSGPAAALVVPNMPPAGVNEDPQKGRWGGSPEANGRRLTAHVTRLPGSHDWFAVRLEVRSTDPRRPLTGSVVFHLHPTFRMSQKEVPVQGGVAALSLVAWGAFTVGAQADAGNTALELDLADLADAPWEFRSG